MSRELPDRSRAFELLDEMGAAALKKEDRDELHGMLRAAFYSVDSERLWLNAAGDKLLELTRGKTPSAAALKQLRAIARLMSARGPANIPALNYMRLAGVAARQARAMRSSRAGRKKGSFGPLKRELFRHFAPGRTRAQILRAFEMRAESVTDDEIEWLDDQGEHRHSRKTVQNALSELLREFPT